MTEDEYFGPLLFETFTPGLLFEFSNSQITLRIIPQSGRDS